MNAPCPDFQENVSRPLLLLSILMAQLLFPAICYSDNARQLGLITSFPLKNEYCEAVVFSPDGRTLAIAEQDKVTLWEVSSRQRRAIWDINPANVHSMVFGRNGRRLFLAVRGDGNIQVRDIATAKIRRILKGHRNPVYSLAITPDGKSLVSVSNSEIKVWNLIKNRELTTLKVNSKNFEIKKVAIGQDGKTIGVARDRVIETVTGPNTSSVAFFGEVHLWDLPNVQSLGVLQGFCGSLDYLAFCPKRDILAAGWNLDKKSVRFWDLKTLRLKSGWQSLKGYVHDAAYTLNGDNLIMGGIGPDPRKRQIVAAHVWIKQASSGKLLHTITFPRDFPTSVDSIALSPNGKHMALAGNLDAVPLYDISAFVTIDRTGR